MAENKDDAQVALFFMKLSYFEFTITHVYGARNYWPQQQYLQLRIAASAKLYFLLRFTSSTYRKIHLLYKLCPICRRKSLYIPIATYTEPPD